MQLFIVLSTFNSWPFGSKRVNKVFPTFEDAEKHATTLAQDKGRETVWIEKLEIGKTELLYLLLEQNVETMSSILDNAKEKFQVEKTQIK